MATKKPFLLRVPKDVLDELKGWAAQEMRSLNGQIEFLLRDALRKRRGGRGERDEGGDPEAPDGSPKNG